MRDQRKESLKKPDLNGIRTRKFGRNKSVHQRGTKICPCVADRNKIAEWTHCISPLPCKHFEKDGNTLVWHRSRLLKTVHIQPDQVLFRRRSLASIMWTVAAQKGTDSSCALGTVGTAMCLIPQQFRVTWPRYLQLARNATVWTAVSCVWTKCLMMVEWWLTR